MTFEKKGEGKSEREGKGEIPPGSFPLSFPLSGPFYQIKSLIVLTLKGVGGSDDGILFERIELNFRRIKASS